MGVITAQQQVCIEQIGCQKRVKNATHHLSVFAASEEKMLSGQAISFIGMQESAEPSDSGQGMVDATYLDK